MKQRYMTNVSLKNKKFHFNYPNGGNTCRLVIRKTYTNIFVTMLDLRGNVVCCVTSGSSGIVGNKRRKTAPQAMEDILKHLDVFFRTYKILNLIIDLRSTIRYLLQYFYKEIALRDLQIIEVSTTRYLAHNGTRGRKIKRKGR